MRSEVEDSLIEAVETAVGIEARFCFLPELSIFAGHFPDRPILPGIYLVEASRLLGERLLHQSCAIREVLDAKFIREIKPGVVVMAEACRMQRDGVVVEEDGHLERLEVNFQTSEGMAARVRLQLG